MVCDDDERSVGCTRDHAKDRVLSNDEEGRNLAADFIDEHLDCDLRIMNGDSSKLPDYFKYLDSDTVK